MAKDKVALLIKKTALVVEKLSNQVLAPYELTTAQYNILMLLYENPDKSIRQADIEAKFAMTNPSVTGIIQNLEKKNLIQRVQHPSDKRSKLLALTEQALSLKHTLYEISESLEGKITNNLTEEEYEQLSILLNKILKNQGHL